MLGRLINPKNQVLLKITMTTFSHGIFDLMLFFTNQNRLYIGTSPITTTKDIELQLRHMEYIVECRVNGREFNMLSKLTNILRHLERSNEMSCKLMIVAYT